MSEQLLKATEENLQDYQLHVKCKHCKGTGKAKRKNNYFLTKDTKKLLGIMERNKLSISKTAKLLDINGTTVHGWLSEKTNPKGVIRPIYFLCLKLRGYK